jgi:hypothetical protein
LVCLELIEVVEMVEYKTIRIIADYGSGRHRIIEEKEDWSLVYKTIRIIADYGNDR